MQNHVFRAYDIRGKVGTEFSIDMVYQLGCAIAFYCKTKEPSLQTVSVARDGRLHSLAIHEQFVTALRASGLNVIDIGMCPTPTLYFSQYWLSVQASFMITASHNPKEYNGIKMCLNKQAIAGDKIQEVKELFFSKQKIENATPGFYSIINIIPTYVAFLKGLFPHLIGLKKHIIFDPGNAVVGTVLPTLIEAFEWKNAHIQCGEIDGNYPNHTADPAEEENILDLRAAVLAMRDGAVGLAFDGDGDRMGVVSESGHLVPGDILLALWGKALLKQFHGAIIVHDVKCSDTVREMIELSGGTTQVSPSGHSNIKRTVQKHDALLAGELSNHFFFRDRYFGFDDGVYAALRLIELLQESESSLDALVCAIPVRITSPEIRIACELAQAQEIIDAVRSSFEQKTGVRVCTIDGVRIETDQGWGLIRVSNTQSVMTLRFEGKTVQALHDMQKSFVPPLKNYFTEGQIATFFDQKE